MLDLIVCLLSVGKIYGYNMESISNNYIQESMKLFFLGDRALLDVLDYNLLIVQ